MHRTMLGELQNHNPRVVYVDERNEISRVDQQVATLLGAPTAA
jgi:aspartate 1-decarboxylase